MQVKYLYSSFKNARKKKVLSEYIFYLQLKSLDLPQGELLKGKVIQTIQANFNYSTASISKKLKKLIQAGFIHVFKHSNNKEWKYVLKSYRYVWNKLGFKFRDYIDRWKFDFIQVDKFDKETLRAHVFTLELARNKSKQLFKEKEVITRKIQYHQDTIEKVKSKKIKERKEKALSHLKSCITGSVDSQFHGRYREEPIVNKISCERASKLLGYVSKIMTVKIYKKSESLQLLSVLKSSGQIASGVSRIDFNNNPAFTNCFWSFGRVFKNEANSYLINNQQKTCIESITSLQTL